MPRYCYLLIAAALPFVGPGCQHYQPQDLSAHHRLEQLESRTLADEGFHSFLQTNAPTVLEKTQNAPWDLESLTWAAIYFHPSMEVARAQWQVAQAGVKTAGGRLESDSHGHPGIRLQSSFRCQSMAAGGEYRHPD